LVAVALTAAGVDRREQKAGSLISTGQTAECDIDFLPYQIKKEFVMHNPVKSF